MRNGKRRSSAIVVAIFPVALLFIGNPDAARHEESIQTEFKSIHPLFEPLGADARFMYLPSYHSLGVASFTERDRRITSVGMLGQVWVFPHRFASPIEPERGSVVVTPEEIYGVE